ncbi:MAG: AAA family ATPase [Dehalococcoidia bacterium]|nr:AAA family ATPase [Dehalococcoidia bacterium]MDZ4245917.1 AAA family ATPase [Dehalococcoidia bacterium]
MPVTLELWRSPTGINQNGRCYLEPETLGKLGAAPDDVLEIKSHHGRMVLARIGQSLPGDKGKGSIRLDRYLRQSLKASLGEKITAEKAATGFVNKVFLAPMTPVAGSKDEVRSFLHKSLAAEAFPLCEGTLFSLTFPGDLGGTIIQAVGVETGPGIFGPDTQVELVTEDSSGPKVNYEDVGGLSKELQTLRELVEIPLLYPQAYLQLGIRPPKGIVFHGPPGVGKTHLTLAIGNEIDAHFEFINGPEIISTAYGQTEAILRGIFEEAGHHAPSIIFIDELDIVAPRRGESGTQADTRMVAQLLTLMDGLTKSAGVIVIGTTNRLDSVDPAMRRPGRFDKEMFISPPDVAGRLEILHIHTRGMPLDTDVMEFLPELARKTHGFVGADLMELCREAGLNSMRRHLKLGTGTPLSEAGSLDGLVVGKGDFEHALTRTRPSAMREALVTVPSIRWEEVGGLKNVKKRLRELVAMPLLHMDTFAKMGIKAPTGIILSGAPGTGKTMLVEALAADSQVNFIVVRGPEIFSKWLGESEEEIRHLFELARRVAPSILFFDQVDAITPKRGQDVSNKTTERVVNQILTEMDSIGPLGGVVVMAATNRIDLIDPAMLRPGRFGTVINIPLPDEEERGEIFAIYLKGAKFAKGSAMERVIKIMAPLTEGYSGAYIQALCQEAKLSAARKGNFGKPVPLRLEDFKEALDAIKLSFSQVE